VFLIFLFALYSARLTDTQLVKYALTPEIETLMPYLHGDSVYLRGAPEGGQAGSLLQDVVFNALQRKGLVITDRPGGSELFYRIEFFDLKYKKLYQGIFKKPEFERDLKIRVFVKIKENGIIKLVRNIEIEHVDTLAMERAKKLHNMGTLSESSGVPAGVSMLIGVLFYFLYFIIK